MQEKEKVIVRLREYERELKEAGIVSVSLFGSVARGDATAESDIDLVAEFDAAKGPATLIDLVRLQDKLSDLLGAQVDLTERRMLKERVRAQMESEAVLVFS